MIKALHNALSGLQQTLGRLDLAAKRTAAQGRESSASSGEPRSVESNEARPVESSEARPVESSEARPVANGAVDDQVDLMTARHEVAANGQSALSAADALGIVVDIRA